MTDSFEDLAALDQLQVAVDMQDIEEAVDEIYEELDVSGVVASRQLRSDNFLAIPSAVQEVVQVHEAESPTIIWNYFDSGDFAVPVLSGDIVQEAEISFVTTSDLYEAKDSGDRDVRLSDQLPDQVLDRFDEGDDVFFVELGELFGGGSRTVWLLKAEDIAEYVSKYFLFLGVVEAASEMAGE